MGTAPRTMAGVKHRTSPVLVFVVLAALFVGFVASQESASRPLSAEIVNLAGAHAVGAGLQIELDAPDGAAGLNTVSLAVEVDHPGADSVSISAIASGSVSVSSGDAAHFPTDGKRSLVLTHTTEYTTAAEGVGRIDFAVSLIDPAGRAIAAQSLTVTVEQRDDTVFAGTNGSAALALRIFDAVDAPGLTTSEAAAQRLEVGVSTSLPAVADSEPVTEVLPWQARRQNGEVAMTGDVGWFDRSGAQRRPFIGGTVRAVGPEGQVLDSTSTDLQGRYSLSVVPTDGVRIEAETTGPGQAVWIPTEAQVTPHRLVSLRFDVAAGDADPRISLTPASTSETNRAMATYQAMMFARPMADVPADLNLGQVTVLYPTAAKSRYVWQTREIRISEHDAYDWDVILHEFGHQVARTVGIDDGPGGNHTIGDNLAVELGSKDLGLRLAWSEGFATFFGTMVQNELQLASLNIENVGDTDYSDVEPGEAQSFTFGVESGNYGRKGAADEVAVARSLWDVYDDRDDEGDSVELGLGTVSHLIVSGATDFFDGWHAITSNMDPAATGEVGCIASVSGAAPSPSGPSFTEDEPPIFRWTRGGLGAELPTEMFRLQIFTDDFAQELLNVDVGNAVSYQPAPDEWLALSTEGSLRWMVTGTHDDEPASRPITGCGMRFTPEPPAASVTATITDDCLQDKGRIDVVVSNSSDVEVDVAVSLTGLSTRNRTVPPNGSVAVAFTGRTDGVYEARVQALGEVIESRTITIECIAASLPPDGLLEVVVKKSCLQNNGRIDVLLTNLEDRAEVYAVYIDQVPPKVRTIGGGETVRVTTTGRADGPRPLRVTRGGVEIHNSMVDIACDIDPDGREVVVVTTCLLDRGRFDIYLLNTTELDRTYGVRLSGLTERSVAVAAGDTARESITGREDGTYVVVVRVGNEQVYTSEHVIDCEN